MVKLLTDFISGLSDTLRVWEEFQKTDIEYFYDSEPLTTGPSLQSSVRALTKTFSQLRLLLQTLEDLKGELCKSSPHGVSHVSA